MEQPDVTPQHHQHVWREVLVVYFATLLAIKVVVWAERALGLPDEVGVLVPILFVYVPIWVLERRGEDPAEYGLVVERLRHAAWSALKVGLVIFPPFLLLNHVYQDLIFARSPAWRFPGEFFKDVLAYHLLYVALPEEFFYRGYMQGRLAPLYKPRWRLGGVDIGAGFLWTALLFTVGHTIVVFRWWHFSILAPALLFGWIRARYQSVMASTFFHAACNILMVVLDTMYGVIPP